jgi:hypothetical protein
MQIELVKNEAGKTVGWTIIGETEEDKLRLGSMRNLLFFGMYDNVVEYDGMTSDPEDNDYVLKLHFATKGYIKEKKEKFRKEIEKRE